MTERPILMSAPMVRAILDDTKTQTRRVLKEWHPSGDPAKRMPPDVEYLPDFTCYRAEFPYGAPGDRLWVRETWQGPLLDNDEWEEHCNDSPSELPLKFNTPAYCVYAADGGAAPEFMTMDEELVRRWRPSIHMPRWASRILLEVTSVRVERLQDISVADCIAEGIPRGGPENPDGIECKEYRALWEQINGPGSWEANPWVWVVQFRRIEP